MTRVRVFLSFNAVWAFATVFFLLLPGVTLGTEAGSDDDAPPLTFQPNSYMVTDHEDAETGYTLLAPFSRRNVYLVDQDGNNVHTWQSDRTTEGTVILLENGTLLRGRSGSDGSPDGVQMLDWNGTVIWDYQPPDGFLWHHDIEPMPNGNILLNMAEKVTYEQMIELGRDPEIVMGEMYIEPVWEIRPKGINGGDIVWMWNPVDHLVQDFDPQRSNYGVVEDHPELIDINFPKEKLPEWQHSNTVTYNPELDQVMITDRNFDELWVIDHSTTTAEAKGHTGGDQGRGGDLLYRWGNPRAYRAGNLTDQVLYGPHDAQWIAPGLPGEGNILVFNNGINPYMTRPEGRYSSVEEMVPPVNATGGYPLAKGEAFGPSSPIWSYNASPPTSFFAQFMGGVQRLPNGHTLVCGGSRGYSFEIDEDEKVVWDYSPMTMFRAYRYYPPALVEMELNATEDELLWVNMTSFASDLDTDFDHLVVRENSPFVEVLGLHLLAMYPEGITMDVFDLSVSDGIFEVKRRVLVNVTPVNDPLTITPIPDIEAMEDIAYHLDLIPYVSDPDTPFEDMVISSNSPYATVERWGLSLLYPNGVLTDMVHLVVSDGDNEAGAEIMVNVAPVNDPPIVAPIPDQVGMEDVPWTIDVSSYVSDVDSPFETLFLTLDSAYVTTSGMELTLIYPDGITEDRVSLSVSDGRDVTIAEINVTVLPVNDPPVVGEVPKLNLTEDEPLAFDMRPYLFDIDDPVEELTLWLDSPFVSMEGHILIMVYPDGVLTDRLTVVVSDGKDEVEVSLVIEVEPVNDAPVVADIPPLTVVEDEPFTFDVGPFISDMDTPVSALTLWINSPFVRHNHHVIELQYPDGVVYDEVLVQVWDRDLQGNTTLRVTVVPVNDPPWWYAPPNIRGVEDVEGEFDLGPFISDIDTHDDMLVVEDNTPYGWMDNHVFRFLYPDGIVTDVVTFTLTDGQFHVDLELGVTIAPVNDPPELTGASVDPSLGDAGTLFRFSVVVRDIDAGHVVPVVVVVIDGVEHRCTIDGSDTGGFVEGAFFYVDLKLPRGEHSFTFRAEDGDGGSSKTAMLTLTVTPEAGPDSMPGWMELLVSSFTIGVALVGALILIKRRSTKRTGA